MHQLRHSLASMSSPERDSILEEARSHLRELLAAGCTPRAALARFGRAEDYAQRFVDEMETEGAMGSRGTGARLHVAGRQINSAFVPTLAAIGIAALGVFSFVAIVMLIAKLSDPVHAGVWRFPNGGLMIGKIRNPSEGTDLLGIWLYPACVGILALSGLIGRTLLLWAVRQLAHGRGEVFV